MARATTRSRSACACVAVTLTCLGAVALIGLTLKPHPDEHGDATPCTSYYPSVVNDARPPVATDVSDQFSLSDFFECDGAAGCSGEPTGLAFSGGGWKALAQHMGTVRALSTLGLALPNALGGNSGGTWFLLLLAHSPTFYEAVQGGSKPIDEVYADFMAAYSTIGFSSIPTPSDPRIAVVVESMKKLLIAASVQNSWLNFIAAMLNAWEPGLAQTPAGTPSNPGLVGRELAYSMALAPSAYLGADGGTLSYGSLEGAYVWSSTLQAPVPAFRWVRANGTSAVVAPLTDGADAVRFDQQLTGQIDNALPLRSALGSVASMTVGAVAASSSAAAGLLGSDTLVQQALEHACVGVGGAHVSSVLLWPELGFENYAVCASGAASECEAPHGRLIDGGYADNMGLVATLSALQRANPAARAFRLVASFANSCAGAVSMPNCNFYDNSLERLFANPRTAPSGSHYPSTPGALYASEAKGPTPTGILSLSQQIFAETAPEWRAHGPSVFRTSVVQLTTVDNAAYGIRGGSTVTLLALFGNVGPSCPTIIAPGDVEATAACKTLATGMQQFVEGLGGAAKIGAYTAGPIVSPLP